MTSIENRDITSQCPQFWFETRIHLHHRFGTKRTLSEIHLSPIRPKDILPERLIVDALGNAIKQEESSSVKKKPGRIWSVPPILDFPNEDILNVPRIRTKAAPEDPETAEELSWL